MRTWQMVLCMLGWSGPDPPSLTNIGMAVQGRGTPPRRPFMLRGATPSMRAGATGPPLKGNHSANMHRGHRSPLRCESPPLATRASPRASPKTVRAEVVGTPRRPDSVPGTRAGSQGIQVHCPLARPICQPSSSARSPEPQDRDTLCLRPEIPVSGRLAHFLPFW